MSSHRITLSLRAADRRVVLCSRSRSTIGVAALALSAFLLIGFGALRPARAFAAVTEYATEETISWDPSDVAAGPEGDLYYTGEGFNIWRLTPSDGANAAVEKENATDWSSGIAPGPDGQLWFTTPSSIGHFTPGTGSKITEIPAGNGEVSPDCIAAGPAGEQAIWFTEVPPGSSSAGKIGRVTTAGAVTEYALPPGNEVEGFNVNGADCIAGGPADTIWFTEPSEDAIGVMNSSGQLLHKFPVRAHAPDGIAEGPEGDMWFTNVASPWVIGRITPAGEVTEFPDPYWGGGDSIIKGPDGNIWFTTSEGIACVNAGGQFAQEVSPTIGGHFGASVGAEGAIWFVGPGERLARLYPVACPAKASGGGESEAEALARKRAEEEAKNKAQAEAAARKKAEEEASAKKRAEEEASAEKRVEEEAKKKAEAEAAAHASVKILKIKVLSKRMLVTIAISEKGTVTIGGNGLEATIVRLPAGAHRVAVALSKKGLAARARRRKTNVIVHLRVARRTVSATRTVRL
jgi:streptogramin lyase